MADAIEVDGLHHGRAPISTASRRGPLVASSRIFGLDVSTGRLAEGDAQVEKTFVNVEKVVAAAGGTLADIVRFSVTIAEDSLRAVVDESWLQRFPEAASRPARHIEVCALQDPLRIQVEFLAYVGENSA